MFEFNLLSTSQITPEAWAPIRRELESTALVRPEHEIQLGNRPFIRFHPTLTFAAADGGLAQQIETRQRFIDVYLGLRKALDNALKGSQSRAALLILDREEANYRTAVRWSIDDGRIREAAALGDTFLPYFQMSGRLRERDAWVTLMKNVTQQGGFTEEAAIYEREDAWRFFHGGDPQGAAKILQALIERLRSSTEFDPAFQLALTLEHLGRLLYHRGYSNSAIPILKEAVGLWEALVEKVGGQPWESLLEVGEHAKASPELVNLAATMGDLANALRNSGENDEALKMAKQSLRIDMACGIQRNVAACHARCGEILKSTGRLDQADDHYELALTAAREAGDKGLEGNILQHQGGVAVSRGQFTRASILHQPGA